MENKGYTMGFWKAGVPRWQCTRCPFDTTESEAAMLAHIEQVHTPKVQKVVRTLPILDRYGNPVQVVEEVSSNG